MPRHSIFSICFAGCLIVVPCQFLLAQCSGGGGGGRHGGHQSPSSSMSYGSPMLASGYSPQNYLMQQLAYQNAQLMAMQRQMYMQQQMLVAMKQQQAPIDQGPNRDMLQAAQHQDLQQMRIDRAMAKRAEHRERIEALVVARKNKQPNADNPQNPMRKAANPTAKGGEF